MRAALLLAVFASPTAAADGFRTQEIDAGLTIGYAVILADVNGDKKPDIVVVDQHKVVWYENPTWNKRVMLAGQTKPDNVCVTDIDLDGDGLPEFVIGAGWKPFDTKNPGTLQWLGRGKTLEEPWTLHPIPCDEPTVHRVRTWLPTPGGKPEILLAPLMGRDATAKANWLDGRPVRLMSYPIPADPAKGPWVPRVVCDDLHVVHNFDATPAGLFAVSYEGVSRINAGKSTRVGPGNQSNPAGSRGSSEIAVAEKWIATVEPWHGNQLVVYAKADDTYARTVIDDKLRWGHAVKFADLSGDGVPELVAGVRDDPNPKAGDTFPDRRGVRIYTRAAGKWLRTTLDPGGVAVEDLACGDLDGDGKIDIVAVGRTTGNCRIYWNERK